MYLPDMPRMLIEEIISSLRISRGKGIPLVSSLSTSSQPIPMDSKSLLPRSKTASAIYEESRLSHSLITSVHSCGGS